MFRCRTRTMPNDPLSDRLYGALRAARGPGKKKLWVLLAIPLGAVVALCVMAFFVLYLVLARGLPSIDWASHYRPPIVTTIWSGDEQLVGEFYNERRVVVPYQRIPKKLKQALIASEDASFFDHAGVSFTGLARAFFKTVILRRHMQGGST